jgi:LysM repeat protein
MRYLKILLVFFAQLTFAQDNIEIDSLTYPWFSPSQNYIQFYSKNSLNHFYESLSNSNTNSVSIIHFGDSHIQSEIPTTETRLLMQKKYGYGGRGLVFPYSTAKTYSSIHYSTKYTGVWNYSKSTNPNEEFPIGVMGVSSKTADSTASFTIVFNSKLPNNYLHLQLFCETDSLSYDLIVESDGKVTPIDVYSSNTPKGVVNIMLPSTNNTITVKCLKSANSQSQFIFHGLQLLNTEKTGLIYSSAGIGGAKFSSLQNINLFNNQLKNIKPDLVIIDLGMSDFIYTDEIKPALEQEIKDGIALIRKTAPLSSIVLFTSQDIFYKNKNILSTQTFSDLIKKISKETDCAYWDWFNVSGGQGSLKLWQKDGLAKSDMIHLTNNGYKIKGKLFFQAIENTKSIFSDKENKTDLVLNTTPKKIEIQTQETETKPITTLSNREIAKDVEKTTIDSIKTIDFQKQILATDSINLSNKTGNLDTIKNQSNLLKSDTNTVLTNLSINTITDSMVSKSLDSTKSLQTQFTKPQTTNIQKIDSLISNDSPHTKASNTADVLRPKTSNEKTQTNNNQEIKSNIKIDQNIKIELVEDYTDSTIYKLENKQITTKNNISHSKLKNYEIARERQYEILNHDTLALNVTSTPTEIKKTVKPKVTPKPKNISYSVRSGDNLSVIAKKMRVSVEDLKKWNNLKSDNLDIGQKLIIRR